MTPTSPISWRNRLLAALIEGDGGAAGEVALLRCEPELAVLTAGGQAQILVLAPPIEARGEFPERLRALLEGQPGGVLYVVVVGGDAELAHRLAPLQRRAPDPAGLGLYHLADTGALSHLAGRKLAALAAAGRALPEIAPRTDEELRQAMREAEHRLAEVQRFADRLRGRAPRVSQALGAACVLLYLVGVLGARTGLDRALLAAGANHGGAVARGELWRLLSSAFLHGSAMHLLANMASLYFLGTFVERVVGGARFLVIYGFSALGGALASTALSQGASVGASGAIWGLMLAGFGLALYPGQLLPAVVARRIRRALVLPLLINAWLSFLPGIDLYAHFGGGLVGLLVSLGWARSHHLRALRAAAALVALAMLAAVAWMLLVARGVGA